MIEISEYGTDASETDTPPPEPNGGGDGGLSPLGGIGGGILDLNTASAEDLAQLPGIGPRRAALIVGGRESLGGFGSVDDLLRIPGLSEAIVNPIRDRITVRP